MKCSLKRNRFQTLENIVYKMAAILLHCEYVDTTYFISSFLAVLSMEGGNTEACHSIK